MKIVPAVLALTLAVTAAHAGNSNTPEIATLEAQPTITKRVRTSPDRLGAAIAAAVLELLSAADTNTLQIVGPPFARYLLRGKQLDVEVGVPLRKASTAKKLGKSIRADTLPGGRVARLNVRGKHEDLPKAHGALDTWLDAHDEKAAGARWEIYVTNPITTPDPAAQETTIVVPLATRR